MLSEESDYPVSALCVEDTLVCGFTRARFESLVEQYPAIGYQVIRNLSSRVTWLVNRVDGMSERRLEDRLYRVLVTVAREHGRETEAGLAIQFSLTHEELAFLTGSHRVTVTAGDEDSTGIGPSGPGEGAPGPAPIRLEPNSPSPRPA